MQNAEPPIACPFIGKAIGLVYVWALWKKPRLPTRQRDVSRSVTFLSCLFDRVLAIVQRNFNFNSNFN